MRVLQATDVPATTRLAVFCDRVIEFGWLAALVTAPIYFNVYSARVFEPDKATMLRSIVLVMLLAWVVKLLEQMFGPGTGRAAVDEGQNAQTRGIWAHLRRHAMVIPALVLTIDYLLATVLSTQPGISFWGSYQRLQGTYTYLSYLAIFFMLAFNLRTREQINRIVTGALVASMPISLYGVAQHYNLDPLPWGGDVTTRVASTMGNAIFIAAYMIMVIPLALARLYEGVHERRTLEKNGSGDALEALLLGLISTATVSVAVAYNDLFQGLLGLILASIVGVTLCFIAWYMLARSTRLGYWIAAIFATLTAFISLFGLLAFGIMLHGITVILLAGLLIGAIVVGLSMRRMKSVMAGAIDWQEIWSALALGALVFGQILALIWFLKTNAPTPQQNAANLWYGALPLIGALLLTTVLLRPRVMTPTLAVTQIFGAGFALLVQLLVVFWSASRGPQLGLLVGLVVFVLLFALRRRMRAMLLGGIIASAFLAVLLILLNIPNGPAEPLRQAVLRYPYIGRIAALAETDGTGEVRLLIWGGVLELIRQNPPTGLTGQPLDAIRPIIGWGPESMYTIYNKVYPPELAYVEARNATPDRSHDGYLDWIVNAGFIGLAIYLAVIALFFVAAWRALWRSQTFWGQILVIALLTGVIAHLVEILVGIPIVASLSYFWAYLALVPLIGKKDGLQEAVATVSEPASVEEERPVVAVPAVAVAANSYSGNGNGANGHSQVSLEGGRKGRKARRAAAQAMQVSNGTAGNGAGAVRGLNTGTALVTPGTNTAVVRGTTRTGTGSMVARRNRRMERSGTHSPGWLIPAAYLGLTALLLIMLAAYNTPIEGAELPMGFSFLWFAVGMMVGAYSLGTLPAGRSWFGGNWWIYGLMSLVVTGIILTVNMNVVTADIWYKRGDAYDKQGQWVLSIMQHQNAVRLQPDQDQYYLFLGRAYMEMAKVTQASGVNDPLLAPSLENARTISQQGLQQLGRMQLMLYSELVLKRALELNPLNTDHYANLGRFYSLLGQMTDGSKDPAGRKADFDNSIAYYQQATILSPHSAVIFSELAQAYIQNNEIDQARTTIQRSIAIDPKYAPTYTTLGDLELNEAQKIMDTTKDKAQADPHIDAALAAHLKALELDPDALFNQGQIETRLQEYIQFGKVDPLVERYKQAIVKNPDNAQYWNVLGYIYSRTNNIPAAIDAYQHAASLSPTDWTVHKNLAVMYQQSGKLDLAIAQAQQALKNAPQDQQKSIQDYITQLQQQSGQK